MSARPLQQISQNGSGTTISIVTDTRATIVVTGKKLVSNASAQLQFTLVEAVNATSNDWFTADAGIQQDDFNDVSLQAGVRAIRFVVTEGNWLFTISQVINQNQTTKGFQ